MLMLLTVAALQSAPMIDVTRGPVATTTVAVTVSLDPQGRVVACRAAGGATGPAPDFPRAAPYRYRFVGRASRSRRR